MRAIRASAGVLAGLLALVLLSPTAHAAGFWPFKDSQNKGKQTGVTLHSAVQHQVKPLGNQLRLVKPIGGNRKPPKTIVAKRPP